MKNLRNATVKDEILARIDALTPENKAKWGKMNVNQLLRHLTLALEIPLEKLNPTMPANAPKLPKWLFRFILLNMKPPKSKAETFVELNTVSAGVNPADFEEERRLLKQAVNEFVTAKKYAPENKLGGKFSPDDWGKLSFNHMDHHLRQFGV
jgi:hypothetical protein